MATLFSRWIPTDLPFFDGTIKLKLRAMDKRQSPEFIREVNALAKGSPNGEAESIAYIERANAFIERTFASYVRLPEPIQEQEEGQPVGDPISDGVGLYRYTGRDFQMAVVLKLVSLASVDDTQAKSSGSPSTSTVEAGRTSTDFPAPNTVAAVNPVSSTATDLIEADELCSVPV